MEQVNYKLRFIAKTLKQAVLITAFSGFLYNK
jgi:hypothetical protein